MKGNSRVYISCQRAAGRWEAVLYRFESIPESVSELRVAAAVYSVKDYKRL